MKLSLVLALAAAGRGLAFPRQHRGHSPSHSDVERLPTDWSRRPTRAGHGPPWHLSTGDDTPGDDTPGDDTPGDATPGDATPGDATPGDDTPGDATPGDDTPGDATPGDSSDAVSHSVVAITTTTTTTLYPTVFKTIEAGEPGGVTGAAPTGVPGPGMIPSNSSSSDGPVQSAPASSPPAVPANNSSSSSSNATAGISSSSIKVPAKWEVGVRWQIVLENPIVAGPAADLVPAQAVVFDIDLGSAQQQTGIIPALHAAGKVVICYFNAGAVQSWDADRASFPPETVGSPLAGAYASTESYVDIRDPRVVDLMKQRIALAGAIGCDAVDPDNIDAWAQPGGGSDTTGFGLTQADYVTYLRALADHAHSVRTGAGNSLLLGQKNAPELAAQLVDLLDFAVLEQCLDGGDGGGGSFCGSFQPYIGMGKPVFQIEYPASAASGTLSDADRARYCGAPNGNAGFSEVLKVSSEDVNGWAEYCDVGGPFVTPTVDE